MKYKLEFTLEAAIKAGACQEGLDRFYKNHPGYPKDKPINILTLLKSNGLSDTLWALRCALTFKKEVITEFCNRCAVRARAYAATAAANAAANAATYASDAARAAANASASADADAANAAHYARAAANAAHYARAAANAAHYARAAAHAAHYARAAANASAYAAHYARAAANSERKKQKQDLLELLEDDNDIRYPFPYECYR